MVAGIKQNFSRSFFTSRAVTRRVDRTERRVLSRFGAFVRVSARSSIRKRKKSSRPGQPPSSHEGTLKRFIYFGYDFRRSSVVVGPLNRQGVLSRGVPPTLEYGGRATVWTSFARKRKSRTRRTVTVAARPFMGPALNRNLPQLPRMWRNSVRR